ncbi:MAG: hypothetical protein E7617_08085 [Ruminococcaceae bacterium]|nr:hypothetical protein [Oscillospiraceae bacterium]
MTDYNGIDISMFLPVAYLILFSLLCGAMLLMTCLWIYSVISGIRWSTASQKKNKARLKRLEERAKTDAHAASELEKLRKKTERRRKRNRPELMRDISLSALFVAVLVMSLSFTVIPLSIDLIKQDHIYYEGEISVWDGVMRYAYIELEDGMVLKGNSIFTRSDTHGTLVYTRRSKLIVGARH